MSNKATSLSPEGKKTLWNFFIGLFELIFSIGKKHVDKHVNNNQ